MKTLEELTTTLESVRTVETEVERTNLVTDLMSDIKEVFEQVAQLEEHNTTLVAENIEYAKLNNKLALKVGETISASGKGSFNEPEPEKRTFEELLKNM